MFAWKSNASRCSADVPPPLFLPVQRPSIFVSHSLLLRQHALRSGRFTWLWCVLFALGGGMVLPPAGLAAQVIPDSTVRDSAIVPVIRVETTRDTIVRRAQFVRPPLSPRRAFLMSFLFPGYSQARLQRATSGALFAGIEMGAIAMLRRSLSDVREVQRQGTGEEPGDFVINRSTGDITPGQPLDPRFDDELERTRKLHVEDWIAALAFNHLIAGADAFVAAQLWDVPVRVSAVPHPGGFMFTASVRW